MLEEALMVPTVPLPTLESKISLLSTDLRAAFSKNESGPEVVELYLSLRLCYWEYALVFALLT